MLIIRDSNEIAEELIEKIWKIKPDMAFEDGSGLIDAHTVEKAIVDYFLQEQEIE